MPSQKAALWDMDGVLSDTSHLHFKTWKTTLSEHGISLDQHKFHYIYGMKNHDFLPYLAGKPLQAEWMDRISHEKEIAFRRAIHGNLDLLPGVLEWLHRFRAWGYKQAVASSAPIENIEAIVTEFNIREYFDRLVEPGDLPGKPDPAVFLKAAHHLNVPPADCVVIEDSLAGVEAAHRAGMHIIAVTNTNPPEALSQADIVVDSLSQLTVSQVEALFINPQN